MVVLYSFRVTVIVGLLCMLERALAYDLDVFCVSGQFMIVDA